MDLPLVLYNVPGRTGCNMLPPVLSRLARDFSNIVGVKEATGDMVQGSETLEACPESFSVLSGDDLTALPLMALGGRGVISVTSNLVPGRVAAMCNAFAKGDPAGASTPSLMSSSPCIRPCSWKAIPFRPRRPWPSWAGWKAEMRLPLCP